MKKKGSRVSVVPGMLFGNDGKQITSLSEAMNEEAKCCGVDCCKNVVVLEDQEDGNTYEMGFVNGVLSVRLAGTTDPFVAI